MSLYQGVSVSTRPVCRVLALALCLGASVTTAQTPGWAWVSGERTPETGVNHGTLGVPNPENNPGHRSSATTWSDANGDLWLFGGNLVTLEDSDPGNDLWMYDRSEGVWIWQAGTKSAPILGRYGTKGVPSTENYPGARSNAAGWSAADGTIWIFGGIGFDAVGPEARLNDLWRYNPADKTWTWMTGSNSSEAPGTYGTKLVPGAENTPGARMSCVNWQDAFGNLWLFGGGGFGGSSSSGNLNDVWRYNIATNQWTWMNGDSTVNERPVASTRPGGISSATAWTDAADNVWIFGGYGYIGANAGVLNDLWKFSMSSNQWEYIKGSEAIYAESVYGTQGTANAANRPGGRSGSSAWSDANGNLWLYAGTGRLGDNDFALMADMWKFNPGSKNWTWIGGTNTEDISPVYGPQGQPGVSTTPGSRSYALTWSDNAGNVLLIGGTTFAQDTQVSSNDMWHFSTVSMQWTWLDGAAVVPRKSVYGTQGVPHAANAPGAREQAQSWTTPDQKLWLMGGIGTDDNGETGNLNDLWCFDPATQMWTWMKGSKLKNQEGIYGLGGTPPAMRVPGGRIDSATWTDSAGQLYLFGGYVSRDTSSGGDTILKNDLWRYNPADNLWTWLHGGRLNQDPAVFGTLGEPDSANVPGARRGAATWIDNDGNLWMFGGFGTTDENRVASGLNDLWKYTPSSNQWTWMGGTKLKNQYGIYGTITVPDNTAMPGHRRDAVSWTDADGHFWLFGGQGYAGSGNSDVLNDLWRYNTVTKQWTWMHGGELPERGAVFGTLGVEDADNVPGARHKSVAWRDPMGNLCLYGGHGITTTGTFPGWLSDIWRYNIATNRWTWIGGSTEEDELPVYAARNQVTVESTPGARVDSCAWALADGSVWLFGGLPSFRTPLNDLWRMGAGDIVPTSASDWQLFE